MDTPSQPPSRERAKRLFLLIMSPLALLVALWSLIHSHTLKHTLDLHSRALAQTHQQLPALAQVVQQHEQQLQALQANPGTEQARAHTEAQQLIEQSQLTWEITGNPTQTSRLLQLALGKLAAYQDTESLHLRQQLQTDLNTLKNLKTFDPEALIARLEGLIRRINQLMLTPGTYQPANISTAPAIDAHPWLSRLQNLVTITKIAPQASEALALHTRESLRQLLLVKLAMSQWAVAQHQPTLYLQNLQTAHQYWQQLAISSSEGAVIEQEFLALLAAPLQPNLTLQSWQSSKSTSNSENTP